MIGNTAFESYSDDLIVSTASRISLLSRTKRQDPPLISLKTKINLKPFYSSQTHVQLEKPLALLPLYNLAVDTTHLMFQRPSHIRCQQRTCPITKFEDSAKSTLASI